MVEAPSAKGVTKRTRKKSFIILGALIIICIAVIIVSVVMCSGNENNEDSKEDRVEITQYPMGRYKYGAVVSNGGPCATIGKRILAKYGNAIDALIATMVCEGAACMHNMGLGGGFILTGYHKASAKVYTLNARETAPAAATVDMFHGNPNASKTGGLSIAVPGELKGYAALYNKYGGRAPWNELFQDTIKLCKDGVPVNKHMAASIANSKDDIFKSPSVTALLMKPDGTLPVLGDKVKLPKLAKTLQIIADKGADALYNGELTQPLVEDIKKAGGIISEKDFADYTVRWEEPIVAPLSNNLTLYSVPPPGSGIILSTILRLVDQHLNTGDISTDVQRITEAFKLAYGARSELGDPHFVNITKMISQLTSQEFIDKTRAKINDKKTMLDPSYYGGHFEFIDDHGTANIAVIAGNGDTVVATSTINLIFGSLVVSEQTGIVLNNEMDDFSAPAITNYFGLPPSKSNFIEPGKRPMSSMCPTIIIGPNGDVRLAIGAAGGTRITTATSLVSIWNLWYNKTIKDAVDEPRFHHQLLPMEWAYEYGMSQTTLDSIAKAGHKLADLGKKWRSSVTSISQVDGTLTTVCDFRRPGSIDGF